MQFCIGTGLCNQIFPLYSFRQYSYCFKVIPLILKNALIPGLCQFFCCFSCYLFLWFILFLFLRIFRCFLFLTFWNSFFGSNLFLFYFLHICHIYYGWICHCPGIQKIKHGHLMSGWFRKGRFYFRCRENRISTLYILMKFRKKFCFLLVVCPICFKIQWQSCQCRIHLL